jgi:UTP--glucose-1-phosphate uridylyltransferase
VLRETAQTLDEDREALADLSRHRYCSTNNLWFDLEAVRDELERRNGILGLALIRNTKTVDPADADSPEVIQIESAMGAAIEVFDGAQLIEVTRDRFLPVKTTNDLLLLRSDVYEVGADGRLQKVTDPAPLVDLDSRYYKTIGAFEQRFPVPPSLQQAVSLTVAGDWTFSREVTVVGAVRLEDQGAPQVVTSGSVLQG